MNIVYISGSPRKVSNTDYLLNCMLGRTDGELIKLNNYTIKPCQSCWACQERGCCTIADGMSTIIMPKLLDADAIVIGTPVYFNNVTAQLKAFMDRTWAIRGQLKDKVGATVVVGRRYGAEGAITAVNSFFLKHDMIVANRGISGIAYEPGEIREDQESLEAAEKLCTRILDLCAALRGGAQRASGQAPA